MFYSKFDSCVAMASKPWTVSSAIHEGLYGKPWRMTWIAAMYKVNFMLEHASSFYDQWLLKKPAVVCYFWTFRFFMMSWLRHKNTLYQSESLGSDMFIYRYYIYTCIFFVQITTKQLLNNEWLFYQGISVAKNNGEPNKSETSNVYNPRLECI